MVSCLTFLNFPMSIMKISKNSFKNSDLKWLFNEIMTMSDWNKKKWPTFDQASVLKKKIKRFNIYVCIAQINIVFHYTFCYPEQIGRQIRNFLVSRKKQITILYSKYMNIGRLSILLRFSRGKFRQYFGDFFQIMPVIKNRSLE